MFAVAAILVRQPWGINKNNATPAWGLWASAFTCWTWVIFHCLNDVWGLSRGWGLLRDLGRNALLAYLLHPLFASVLERFFGLYASVNSFTQLLARYRQRDGILKRWPPRAGDKPVA